MCRHVYVKFLARAEALAWIWRIWHKDYKLRLLAHDLIIRTVSKGVAKDPNRDSPYWICYFSTFLQNFGCRSILRDFGRDRTHEYVQSPNIFENK
jgi:hypothetical protein